MECKYVSEAETLANWLELIDTLWNVNVSGDTDLVEYTGINRYIMECK